MPTDSTSKTRARQLATDIFDCDGAATTCGVIRVNVPALAGVHWRRMKDDPSREVAQIGKRVKLRREAAGLTLDQLSRLSGVSKAMLSQVERSRANPTVVVLLKIAGGLGCTLDDIV